MSTAWKSHPPTIDDIQNTVEYFFIRGGGFNYDICVRVNQGVNSVKDKDERRQYFHDINFEIFADGFHNQFIWSERLKDYGVLNGCQWFGPIQLPKD